MRENPKPFEIYKHFKGNQYQIITLATDSEDGKDLVVYQALYGDFKVYVRELSGFMSPVDRVKYPAASQEYRFEKVALSGKKETEAAMEAQAAAAAGPDISEPVAEETDAKESAVQEADVKAPDVKEPDEEESDAEELSLDPAVLEFLDADSLEEKLNILAGVHHRITDEMLVTMAVASDVELNKGSTEEKYAELQECLMTKARYEIKRLY